MKVFVLESCIQYEGRRILGIFSTLEAAESVDLSNLSSLEYTEITEYEVDSLKESTP